MYTIVAASQKGGSGKTTLSGHLAVEAQRSGAGAIALIDTDPQGSLAHWWNARQAPEPHFVKAGLMDLEESLAKLEQAGVRIAVIDTPPAITQSISRVVAHADLVLVPTRPSPHDLRAVGATVDIAERHGKQVVFVINAATARARITGDIPVGGGESDTAVMETALASMEVIQAMAETGNPNSVSDAGVGALAARSAVMGAYLNVKINAAGLSDKTFAADILAKGAAIQDKAIRLEDAILKVVNEKIG